MLDMLQQERIRDMAQKGYTPSEIRKATGFSYPTIRKYIGEVDFSPKIPLKKMEPSLLDPYKPLIGEMLDEDRHCYHKQHHTAKRIAERLYDEHGYRGSYSTVQRYVKMLRTERKSAGSLFSDLKWPDGTMQADFGQADFDMSHGRQRMHYLACSFPQSNHALAQTFGDELTVCVTQGLKDVFEHVGGVPPTIVFDNATDAGRRICGVIREAGLFRRFRMHYGFEAVFCNPESGHEKGNVESKVGWIRRNLFVPVPKANDLRALNARLLTRCDEASAREEHYEKGKTWLELFEADRGALIPLPAVAFDCVDWQRRRADGYGKITLTGGSSKHRYLASAHLAGCQLLVGVRAYEVQMTLSDGTDVRTYSRRTDNAFTDDEDPVAALDVLRRKPRSFRCSSMRGMLDDAVKEHLDAMESRELQRQLQTMFTIASAHGMPVAAAAFEDALAATGSTSAADVEMTAARIACTGRRTADHVPGTKLIEYDELIKAHHQNKGAANG